MRGRTIYFQGRRILVFCGEKKNKPHSTNDRFGNANAEIPVGENTEIKNTASEFGESDDAAELANNDDSIVTITNARPQVDNSAEVGQKITASPTATIRGESKSGAEINQRINGAALILRNGKAKTGIAVGENTETLTESNPMFGAAAEDISAGHKADTFTALGIKRDSAAAGLFIGENIASKKYTFLSASVKSGVGEGQNAEANVYVPIGDYLLFENIDTLIKPVGNGWYNGVTEWSADGETWHIWSNTTTIRSGADKKLYVRGYNNTSRGSIPSGLSGTGANIKVSGNVENLIDYQQVASGNNAPLFENCFRLLFSEFSNLYDVSGLVLPSQPLPKWACSAMFYHCVALIKPASLKGLTFGGEGCLEYMYSRCSAMEYLPEFPTNVLKGTCCQYLFNECTKIRVSATQSSTYKNAYRIPASGTIASTPYHALESMFANTGGTFTGTPTINTTYYTSNEIIS